MYFIEGMFSVCLCVFVWFWLDLPELRVLVPLLLALVSLGLAVPLILTWLQTGLVPRFPTAILSAGIGILSGLSLTAGLILETVTIGRRETRHLHYLASGPVPADLLE